MVWAADASSIPCLAVPTSRNLAVASPGVNKFGWLGYANVRQKRLPSHGTHAVTKYAPARCNLDRTQSKNRADPGSLLFWLP